MTLLTVLQLNLQTVATNPKLETLTDDFEYSAPINWTKWPNHDESVATIDSGRGRIQIPANTFAYNVIQTGFSYDATDSYIFAKVTPAATGSSGTPQTFMGVTADNDNSIFMLKEGTSFRVAYKVGGVETYQTLAPYDETSHAWWRIRFAGSTAYFGWSADGLDWTESVITATPSWSLAAVNVTLMLGTWVTTDPASTAYFDNINTVPVAKTPVTVSQSVTWNVRTDVTASQAVVYDVRTPVTTSTATSWNVRTPVEASTAVSWSVRTPVTSSQAVSWNVRTPVTAIQTITWGVAGVTSIVVQSQVVSWNVRTSVTSAQAVAWNVRTAVTSMQAASWNVRTAVSKAQSVTWNVRTPVAVSSVVMWNVRTAVVKSVSVTWSVRVPVSASSPVTWNVRTAVSETAPIVWNVRTSVVSATSVTWRVRVMVTHRPYGRGETVRVRSNGTTTGIYAAGETKHPEGVGS